MLRCDIVRKMTMTAARLHHVYRGTIGTYKNAFLDCIIVLRIGNSSQLNQTC